MKPSQKFLLLSALIVFGSGCGNDDLPDYFRLDRLRVLSANTVGSATEFNAGAAGVQIEFHVIDPLGAGRTLTYSIDACVDPGVGSGATPTCRGNPTRTVLVASSSFTPGSAATNYYGVLTTPAFSIPSAGVMYIDPLTLGSRPAYEQANGVNYLVVLTLTTPTGESLTSFKRVVVSTKATKNQNPTFSSPALLFAGVNSATYTLSLERFSMLAQVPGSSAESYVLQKSDGSSQSGVEELLVTWMSTSGEIRFTRTSVVTENRFTPLNPLPSVTTLIAVLRDDRGGSAITVVHKP